MFEDSDDERVAGLDVEYTKVLGREKDLKDEERKKPAVIQVCVHNVCLVYHICHANSDSLTHRVKSPRARPHERHDGRGRRDHDTGYWQPLDLRSNGRMLSC